MVKKYKYELHCHTSPVSVCATADVRKAADIYAARGYDGLVITEHYSPMTFYRHPFAPQKEIETYLSSYHTLKEYCGNDFTVLLGLELRHYATVNDYLVYGVEEEWLRTQGNMLAWGEKKMYGKLHEAGLFVCQAHPYRNFYFYRCNPRYIDAVEVYNGHTRESGNRKADEWADKIGKIKTVGSDFHHEKDTPCCAILTDGKIENNKQLLQVLKTENYERIFGFAE